MNSSLIFAKAHGGIGMLLMLIAFFSLVLALKTVVSNNNRSAKLAHITGLVETILAGIVLLTGIICVYTGPWPLTQMWMWLGLVIMVAYSIIMKRVTKPARLAADDADAAKKWAMVQTAQLVLLVVGFVLMKAKPF